MPIHHEGGKYMKDRQTKKETETQFNNNKKKIYNAHIVTHNA